MNSTRPQHRTNPEAAVLDRQLGQKNFAPSRKERKVFLRDTVRRREFRRRAFHRFFWRLDAILCAVFDGDQSAPSGRFD